MSITELELREREVINELKNNLMSLMTSHDLEEREKISLERDRIKRELGKVKYQLLVLRRETNLKGKTR